MINEAVAQQRGQKHKNLKDHGTPAA